MILDLDQYRASVIGIKLFLEKKDPEKRFEYIGEAAVVSGCHIVAVCHYYGELYGYTEDLLQFIKRLMIFYKIDDVHGINKAPKTKP